MSSLKIAKASHEAALYSVTHWHYSRKLPSGKLFIRGVWENGKFIGVVIFSRGATNTIGSPYGLQQTECVELTRVALDKHEAPVSQIVALALKDLKAGNPGLRLVVSYADPMQGHAGGIYQAGNWTYVGQNKAAPEFVINGVQMHMRSIHAKGWRQTLEWIHANVDSKAYKVEIVPKHKYLMPLDRAMRKKIAVLALSYPHAVEDSMVSRGDSVTEGQVQTLSTAPLETPSDG